MNDNLKHGSGVLASAIGLVGHFTLSDWNQLAGIFCGVAGGIAASLTIISWIKGHLKKRKEKRGKQNATH